MVRTVHQRSAAQRTDRVARNVLRHHEVQTHRGLHHAGLVLLGQHALIVEQSGQASHHSSIGGRAQSRVVVARRNRSVLRRNLGIENVRHGARAGARRADEVPNLVLDRRGNPVVQFRSNPQAGRLQVAVTESLVHAAIVADGGSEFKVRHREVNTDFRLHRQVHGRFGHILHVGSRAVTNRELHRTADLEGRTRSVLAFPLFVVVGGHAAKEGRGVVSDAQNLVRHEGSGLKAVCHDELRRLSALGN